MNRQEAIETEQKLMEFKKSLIPKLETYSKKRHIRLDNIPPTSIFFDENGITFIAEGYAMGHFEDSFDLSWAEFDKL